jgi:N-acetylmuramoyl-L-alanine amidase
MKLLFFTLLLSLRVLAQDCENCAGPVPVPEPEWPIQYIDVKKVDYQRNKKAEFCSRPPEIVDTIVLHHTETPSTKTAIYVNDLHLNRESGGDPWYMVAYSYLVNAPYPGASVPDPIVTEGRPMDLVGAHAGSNIFVPMDEEQTKAFADGKIVCGKEGQPFKVDPTMVKGTTIKANVTTIGLVVIGNYAPIARDNPGGYSPRNPRYPTEKTQDMIARLSCQLQKKYPRMKSIRWHSYYHSTSCPGTIKNYIGQIKAKAKELGCEFN